MPNLSKRSLQELMTCDVRLQKVISKTIKLIDFTVLDGHRTEPEQEKAFETGRSKVQWPNSKHNQFPSLAVDLAPYPIDWDNRSRFVLLAELIMQEAEKEGIKIRWGGDFNRDGNYQNDKFIDLPHFELVD